MSKIIPILISVILLSACGGAPASTPSPEPLGTPTSPPKTACSSPENWTIQYNRSGGFAGFNETLTLDSDGSLMIKSERPPVDEQTTISDEQVNGITELLVQACPFETESTKGVCADCFFYDLNIQMDGRSYSVQATDVALTEELQALVGILSQLLQETEQ